MRAGSNRQLDRLRQSSDVHVSLDDEDMREVDPDEHRETLGAGIPQQFGQNSTSFVTVEPKVTQFWRNEWDPSQLNTQPFPVCL